MWGILLFKSPFYSTRITLLQNTGMENGARETVVIPTGSMANKEIIIESGPQPEIREKGGKNDNRR